MRAQFLHQRIGFTALREMALVPDSQDRGHHGARVVTDFPEIQSVEMADPLDEVHVEVNGVILAAPDLEIGKGVVFRQLERQERVGWHDDDGGRSLAQEGLIVATLERTRCAKWIKTTEEPVRTGSGWRVSPAHVN